MDKKKVMLYGIFSSILLLISTLVPYYNLVRTNEDGNIISNHGMNFLGTFFTLIHFILIIIVLILSIRNYKIVKNNSEKNISNPFWLLMLLLLIATGIIAMQIGYALMDWAADESGNWLSHTKAIGYYLFRVALIGESFYILLIFKINSKKDKTKFLDTLKRIVKTILILILMFVVGGLGIKYLPDLISYISLKSVSKENNSLLINPITINDYLEVDVPLDYLVIGKDVTYEEFYNNYKNYIGKKVLMYGEVDDYHSEIYKSSGKYLNNIHLSISDDVTAYAIYYSDKKREFVNKYDDSNSLENTNYGYFLGTIKNIERNYDLIVNVEPDKIYFMDFLYSELEKYVGNTYYSKDGEFIRVDKYRNYLEFDIYDLNGVDYLSFSGSSGRYNGTNIFHITKRYKSFSFDERIQYYDFNTTLELYDDKIIMKGYTIDFTYHSEYENDIDIMADIVNNDEKVFYKSND